MGVVKPLFVQGVAGFVHDGVKAREGVLLVKSCRETRVARPQTGGKRVCGGVHAARFKVKAHVIGHRLAEDLLGLDGKHHTFGDGGFIGAVLGLGDGLKEGHETLTQARKERVVVLDGHAHFVFVQKHVVRC